MPRTCTVCAHPERAAIDRALVQGVPLRDIAGRYDLSKSAVERHQADHLPVLLVKAHDAEETARADDLLGELRDLQATTLGLLRKAERAGKLGTAVMAIGEARRNLELLAKLIGQLDERPVLNLLIAPEWLTVRATLLSALAPYPEARVAVAERLATVEASHVASG